jgi:hypothetical protein
MMSTLDEREQTFERKYSQEQEFAFRVTARRNKIVGLWAAGHLSLQGPDAERYASSVVAAELQKGGEREVIAKLVADLAPKGIDKARIDAELQQATEQAKEQLGAPK